MGAVNSELLQNIVFYQEEVEVGDRIRDGEYLSQLGGPMITIQQRRLLQILRAKEKPSPLIWVKKDAQRLWSVRFPIHFIDFEAATYAIDRKSTRLNSSHVAISYAVFCLKK